MSTLYLELNTISGYFHDFDKLLMLILFIPEETVNQIHLKYARHHAKNARIKNIESAAIDLECARFTKADKPLNARETFEKYYHDIPGVGSVLRKFNLQKIPDILF